MDTKETLEYLKAHPELLDRIHEVFELERDDVGALSGFADNKLVHAAIQDGGDSRKVLAEVMVESVLETVDKFSLPRKVLGKMPRRDLPEDAELELEKTESCSRTSLKFSLDPNNQDPDLLFPFHHDAEFLMEKPQHFIEMLYNEAVTKLLLQEDKLFLEKYDSQVTNGGKFATVKSKPADIDPEDVWKAIREWDMPPTHVIIHSDVIGELLGNYKWAHYYEPAHKAELATEGFFGTLMGMKAYTDCFRYDTMRSLEDNHLLIFCSRYDDSGGKMRVDHWTDYDEETSTMEIRSRVIMDARW